MPKGYLKCRISLSLYTGADGRGKDVQNGKDHPFKTCICEGKAKQKEIGVRYFIESCVHLRRCDILLSGRGDSTSYIHKITRASEGHSGEGTPVWAHSSFGFRNLNEYYYTHMFAVALGVHMNTNSSECCCEMLSVMMTLRLLVSTRFNGAGTNKYCT